MYQNTKRILKHKQQREEFAIVKKLGSHLYQLVTNQENLPERDTNFGFVGIFSLWLLASYAFAGICKLFSCLTGYCPDCKCTFLWLHETEIFAVHKFIILIENILLWTYKVSCLYIRHRPHMVSCMCIGLISTPKTPPLAYIDFSRASLV